MKTKCLLVQILFTAQILCGADSSSQAQVDKLKALLDRAANSKDSVEWANLLMQADREAEKLEDSKPNSACGERCIRVATWELHYRYNEIQGQENYQHDLLQLIARVHQGDPDGAEALVRLLPTGCQTIATGWIPYFKTVIDILEFRKWKALRDPRLTKMRAEAYETWWSLSQSPPDDPVIADAELKPEDFLDGAAQARERAIRDYQELVSIGKADRDVMEHLRKLQAGQDTEQRNWYCYGD
ncbi:MAG: hypothetical protein JOY62_14235 [Acidobacteriaceae bacterium]|nr:hypothetical protein [Acidobacteriaceae bacterium]MBV9781119.1 hypothetical protein [Acidobacteriaceae bacterium]